MGIRFRCHHCESELHVKDFQAGKRGRCPECKGKFRIPLSDAAHSLEADDLTPDETVASATSVSEAPAAQSPVPVKPQALTDAPQAKWFVRPTSGGQYGPAPSESMWQWLGENRIGNDSLVWCEGWPEWLVAGEVFADFFASCQVDERYEAAAKSKNTSDNPTSGSSISEVRELANPQTPPATQSSTATSLSDRNRSTRKQRRRRNYTIMIAVLSVIMISLIVALAVVLSNQPK